ncbi:hypothetical protein [Chryseobacterium koreense]|uniref:hypothetical protein n=1 Tax=Chryseobacterium koreense TaxID=232216 RepID=UPI0026EC3E22|nr:hypothetical protein [Chryseobacterium koreense]
MIRNVLFLIILLGSSSMAFSQENEEAETIDPSKPTNLYTQVNVDAELNSYKAYETYGSRFNFQYAPNPDNLILGEIPVLYNPETKKMGFSDMRIRYFNVRRLQGSTLMAIAPFTDIYMPTGNESHGLGGGTWSLSVGLIAGLVFSNSVSVFPGLSYVYLTKLKQNGALFQTNISLKFNDSLYAFFNPNVLVISNKTTWQSDSSLNYIVKPNLFKVKVGWSPNFTDESNTYNIGGTFYF